MSPWKDYEPGGDKADETVFTLISPAGIYQTKSFASLVFQVLKHRCWHFFRGDGWID